MKPANRIIAAFVLLLTVGLMVALLMPSATRSTRASQGNMAQAAPSITNFNGLQEGQELSGKAAIEAVVSGGNITQVVFQLDGPQPMTHVEHNPPYYILGDNNGVPNQWDTTQFPNGDYTLTATATNTAGQRGALAAHFRLANQAPAQPTATAQPEPTAQPTAQPTATAELTPTAEPAPTAQPEPTAQPTAQPEPTAQPTAQPTPTSAPTISGFNGVADGQTLSGNVAIEAIVSGDNITQVVFQLDGPQSMTHVEHNPPYYILGDNNGVPNEWDTTQYPNGDYTLTATATNAAGQSGSLKVYFPIVNNVQPQPTTVPSPTATPVPSSILWSSDFETGDFSQWFPTQGHDGGIYNTASGDASITTDIAHSGKYAAKLTISNANGQNGNQAVRIFRWHESRTYPAAYYSIWFYFPQHYTPAAWWNVFQFKSVNATRNDPFWILNVGNRADSAMYFYLYDWINQRSYDQTTINIPVGRWTHVEVYYKQSTSNTGHITVWQDGATLFDLDGITTGFADATESANWSVNNYTNNITPNNATIYIDDAVITVRLALDRKDWIPVKLARNIILSNRRSDQTMDPASDWSLYKESVKDFPCLVGHTVRHRFIGE